MDDRVWRHNAALGAPPGFQVDADEAAPLQQAAGTAHAAASAAVGAAAPHAAAQASARAASNGAASEPDTAALLSIGLAQIHVSQPGAGQLLGGGGRHEAAAGPAPSLGEVINPGATVPPRASAQRDSTTSYTVGAVPGHSGSAGSGSASVSSGFGSSSSLEGATVASAPRVTATSAPAVSSGSTPQPWSEAWPTQPTWSGALYTDGVGGGGIGPTTSAGMQGATSGVVHGSGAATSSSTAASAAVATQPPLAVATSHASGLSASSALGSFGIRAGSAVAASAPPQSSSSLRAGLSATGSHLSVMTPASSTGLGAAASSGDMGSSASMVHSASWTQVSLVDHPSPQHNGGHARSHSSPQHVYVDTDRPPVATFDELSQGHGRYTEPWYGGGGDSTRGGATANGSGRLRGGEGVQWAQPAAPAVMLAPWQQSPFHQAFAAPPPPPVAHTHGHHAPYVPHGGHHVADRPPSYQHLSEAHPGAEHGTVIVPAPDHGAATPGHMAYHTPHGHGHGMPLARSQSGSTLYSIPGGSGAPPVGYTAQAPPFTPSMYTQRVMHMNGAPYGRSSSSESPMSSASRYSSMSRLSRSGSEHTISRANSGSSNMSTPSAAGTPVIGWRAQVQWQQQQQRQQQLRRQQAIIEETGNGYTQRPGGDSSRREARPGREGDGGGQRLNLIVNYLGDMTNAQLRALCSKHADVLRCRVVIDNRTGRTRGFAFVRVATPEGATRVIEHLNGYRHSLGGVPKRLKVAYARPRSKSRRGGNVFVANLHSWVSADDLKRVSAPYGTVLDCKVLTDARGRPKGCGFVRFSFRREAEVAIAALHNQRVMMHDKGGNEAELSRKMLLSMADHDNDPGPQRRGSSSNGPRMGRRGSHSSESSGTPNMRRRGSASSRDERVVWVAVDGSHDSREGGATERASASSGVPPQTPTPSYAGSTASNAAWQRSSSWASTPSAASPGGQRTTTGTITFDAADASRVWGASPSAGSMYAAPAHTGSMHSMASMASMASQDARGVAPLRAVASAPHLTAAVGHSPLVGAQPPRAPPRGMAYGVGGGAYDGQQR